MPGFDSNAFEEAVGNLYQLVANVVCFAYPDESAVVHVFTDASDAADGAALFQAPADVDAATARRNLTLQPLYFHSGKFTPTQLRWHTIDKEAYVIFALARKLPDLLTAGRHPFIWHTDARTVYYLFNPTRVTPDVRMASVSRVHRWAHWMQQFRYTVSFISGNDNVWADMLSRFASPGATPVVQDDSGGERAVVVARAAHADGAGRVEFQPPSLLEIRSRQQEAVGEELWGESTIDGSLLDGNMTGVLSYDPEKDVYGKDGKVYVPEDNVVRRKIMALAHGGVGGHRSRDVVLQRISETLTWYGMQADVNEYVRSCLVCGIAHNHSHRRAHGIPMRGTHRFEVLHMDFLYMGSSRGEGPTYLLTMVDGFTGFTVLFEAQAADAENAAKGFLQWTSLFHTPDVVVTDGGSHFVNETFSQVGTLMLTHHHVTAAHRPQGNGLVESVNGQVLRVARAMLQELRLPPEDWRGLTPLITAALNDLPSTTRADKSPTELMLGQRRTNPVTAVITGSSKVVAFDTSSPDYNTALEDLRVALDALTTTVYEARDHIDQPRLAQLAERERLHGGFIPGDVVLLADMRKHRHKLSGRYTGPYVVVATCSPFVYKVKHVVTGHQLEAHAERLYFYAEHLDNAPVDVMEQAKYALNTYDVGKLVKVSKAPTSDSSEPWQVLVRWHGFSAAEDSYEPPGSLYQSVPHLITELLSRSSTPKGFKSYMATQYGLVEP